MIQRLLLRSWCWLLLCYSWSRWPGRALQNPGFSAVPAASSCSSCSWRSASFLSRLQRNWDIDVIIVTNVIFLEHLSWFPYRNRGWRYTCRYVIKAAIPIKKYYCKFLCILLVSIKQAVKCTIIRIHQRSHSVMLDLGFNSTSRFPWYTDTGLRFCWEVWNTGS